MHKLSFLLGGSRLGKIAGVLFSGRMKLAAPILAIGAFSCAVVPAQAKQLIEVAPEAAYASSKYNDERGPVKAVNGSGIKMTNRTDWVNWTHSAERSDLWMSTSGDSNGWFIVKFASPVKLKQMKLWNFNNTDYTKRGVKTADIYWSASQTAPTSNPDFTDGAIWTRVGTDTFEFSQAPGAATYTGDNEHVVDLGGVNEVLYLALDIKSNFGSDNNGSFAGISELVFWEETETYVPGDGVNTPLKVLAIGNSFSRSAYQHLPAIVSAAGKKLDFLNLYYGGCSLQQHWEHHDQTSFYQGFDKSVASATSPIPSLTTSNATLDDILAAERWDIVTLQQNSGNSADVSTYEPYFSNLVDTVKAKAPSAEIWIHQTWSWASPKTSDPDAMYDSLAANYSAKQTEYSIPNQIPAGYAVQLYRHEYGANPLQSDNQHLSAPVGEYLQACVWAGELFGIDAKTISYKPSSVDDLTAGILRSVAAQAVASNDYTDYATRQPDPVAIALPEFGTELSAAWGRAYPLADNGTVEQVVELTHPSVSFSFKLPAGLSSVRYLAVGGGGAGGTCDGGGGAGGKFLAGSLALDGTETECTVSIGAGGAARGERGGATRYQGLPGGATSLSVGETDLSAAGGGGGGAYNMDNGTVLGPGSDGGGDAFGYAVQSVGPNGTKGGASFNTTTGGGGAGAGGNGATGTASNVGGAGGEGLSSDITGTLRWYAAGGGGGVGGDSAASTPGLGGSGVGGNGGRSYQEGYATPAMPNTGSGGGGGGRNTICLAGSGADGIVVLRYAAPAGVSVHSVRFLDWDGTLLANVGVVDGNAATPPADPTREDYLFTGWDTAFGNVTSDLVVTATYRVNPYCNIETTAFGREYDLDADDLKFHVLEYTATGSEFAFTLPSDAFKVDVLVVGGGAGGGGEGGGGGGAVYLRENAPLLPGGEFTVSVGAGGAGSGSPFDPGSNGVASSIAGSGFSVEALGGMTGNGYNAATIAAGGNGGGGAPGGAMDPTTGQAAVDEWHHQGFEGGKATNYGSSNTGCGGGGGGAGAGANGQDSQIANISTHNDTTIESAGKGGDGWMTDISGEEKYYGGGGGGGVRRSNFKHGGAGGLGGGGEGFGATPGFEGLSGNQTEMANPKEATAGVDGLGGGGGGGGWSAKSTQHKGGKGGSGIVLVRYARTSTNPDLSLNRVDFKDVDGTLLSVSFVGSGDAAVAPAEPTYGDGRLFVRWDRDFSNVQSDMVVTAVAAMPQIGPASEAPWGYVNNLRIGDRRFVVSVVTNTSETYSIQPPEKAIGLAVLAVGGGGGGGGEGGGGGGAVYFRDGLAVPSSALSVKVGAGGAGAAKQGGDVAPFNVGSNGGTTSVSGGGLSVEATGGMTGLGWNERTTYAGANGGGGAPSENSTRAPTSGTAPNDEWHHQGFTGGKATNSGKSDKGSGAAGGGAGAGGDGQDSQVSNVSSHNDTNIESAGAGGPGWECAITGENTYYGGGGGGGVRRSNFKHGGAGGLGGGGEGFGATPGAEGPSGSKVAMTSPKESTPGTDGLGGGGGGGGWDAAGNAHNGAKGGSGVVILRWELLRYRGAAALIR